MYLWIGPRRNFSSVQSSELVWKNPNVLPAVEIHENWNKFSRHTSGPQLDMDTLVIQKAEKLLCRNISSIELRAVF